jgi:hypothetical protein
MKAVIAILAVALILTLAYALEDRSASTADIDRSLQELNVALKQAKDDDALYSGGLVKALIAVRIETVKGTIAMLEQKRQSILHRVCLGYEIRGSAVKPAPAEGLRRIEQDMNQTEKEIERARSEDAKYSGGLIKGLIAARIATDQMTLAGLNQRYLFAKYGLPTLVPFQSEGTSAPARPTVPDKSAL